MIEILINFLIILYLFARNRQNFSILTKKFQLKNSNFVLYNSI